MVFIRAPPDDPTIKVHDLESLHYSLPVWGLEEEVEVIDQDPCFLNLASMVSVATSFILLLRTPNFIL